MNPDAAPTLAPIAAGRDGEGELVAELDSVAGVLQMVGFLVVTFDLGLGLGVAVDFTLEAGAVLEISVGVSISAAGTNGVPKPKSVKFCKQQDPCVTGVPFSRTTIPQHHVLA